MLSRLPCWQCNFQKFLIDNQSRPFAYGRFDCCLFVCDAIQAMTGADVAASFRGKYSSAKEARQFGSVQTIAETVTADFEMPEVGISYAQRGDVALIKRPRDYSLGILDLDGMTLLALAKSGIVRIPLCHASRAWRV